MIPLALALACTRAPPIAGDDFRALHARIYEVYRLDIRDGPPDRDALHALLAGSFSGEALTREYIEHYTTLARMREAGIWVELQAVRYDDVLPLPGDRVEAEWTVSGLVHHPTHTHSRINRYHATYTLAETAAGPRIVATRMKDMQRLAEPPPG